MKREMKTLGMKTRRILTLVKYLFALGVTVFAFTGLDSKNYLFGSLLELGVIILLSDLFARRWPKAGNVISSILTLLYNTQQFILYFGSTYLTMIMLTNISSAEDLGGRAFEYILAIVLVIVLSSLPICPIRMTRTYVYNALIGIMIADLGFTMTLGSSYSPLYGYANVAVQAKEQHDRETYINSLPDTAEQFYSDSVESGIDKPADLPEQPNVILIMTKGLSQSIVEDERNLMPNVRSYEDQSVDFESYFNHTAATYRGIIGQLFSGYQNNNLDQNHLASIQSIMKDQGYYTSFINTEMNNIQFTGYLNDLGFDAVIGKDSDSYLTDKEAYDLLLQTAEDQSSKGQPFFTTIYTFNTHVSLDSDDEKYGNGSEAELNKFYNCDYQFGRFMDAFNNSDLADNTIIVFTADHCTYLDDAFRSAFPDTVRVHSFLDRIPFLIYYKGVTPQKISADGRNSLCMVPTILDYLDISAPNYFLGNSLFININNDSSPYDLVFTIDNTERVSTKDAIIQGMDSSVDSEVEKNINNYYAAAQQERK